MSLRFNNVVDDLISLVDLVLESILAHVLRQDLKQHRPLRRLADIAAVLQHLATPVVACT